MIKNKFYAFTLAEVLVTLGVIGVVAAMTIPNLITSFQKRQLEARIKSNFAIIQQTIKLAEADGASYDIKILDGNDKSMKEWFDTFIGPHLKILDTCYNKPGCWHKAGIVKSLTGNAPRYEGQNGIGGNIITFRIMNGTMFNIDGNTAADMASFGLDTNSDGLTFYFDANGEKKPNRFGIDVYVMIWTDKGLVPAGHSRSKAEVETNCLNGDGYYCLQYMNKNGWKIPDSVWKRKF